MAAATKMRPPEVAVATLASFGFLAFLYWVSGGELFKSGQSPTKVEVPSDGGAIVMCQRFVEARLKSPKTADFPFLDRPSVARDGSSFVVRSYVDAQNAFGATLRSNFVCKVTHKGGEESDVRNWSLDDLAISQ